MPSVHARLGPSGCEQWLNCTASVALIERLRESGSIPPRQSSIYAAEGTVAHSVREDALIYGLSPFDFVGTFRQADGFRFEITEEMAEHLIAGIDWCRTFTDEPHVEVQVDLSPWLPDQFGTCDTAWIHDDTLYICDLKYGMGENVDPTDNKQLKCYALGMWHWLGRPAVKTVLLMIDQPRAGGLKDWSCSLDHLLAFGEDLKKAYAEIESGETKFAPGKKACRWCPVKDTKEGCAARERWLAEMFVEQFDDLDDPDFKLLSPDGLTPAKRWHIVHHADDIRRFLTQLYQDSLDAALTGNPDPGSKAIAGDKGDRFFTDPKKAESLLVGALGEAAYQPKKLIGIGQIQALVKPGRKRKGHPQTWAALQEIIDQPDGKPKLVPVSNPKPAIKSLRDEFDDLD